MACKDGLLVGKAIVSEKDSRCPVRIMNIKDELKRLCKGDIIAGAEVVEELKADSPPVPNESDQLPAHVQEIYDTTIVEAKISPEVATMFKQFLRRHANVFAKSDMDLGRTTLI